MDLLGHPPTKHSDPRVPRAHLTEIPILIEKFFRFVFQTSLVDFLTHLRLGHANDVWFAFAH